MSSVRIFFFGLLLMAPGIARAEGPVDRQSGMARLVDGPALREAFGHAHEGDVEVGFDLAEDGSVLHPHILHSTPPGVFDDAALSMLKDAHLPTGAESRASESGSPAPHDHRLVIHFKDDANPQAKVESSQ